VTAAAGGAKIVTTHRSLAQFHGVIPPMITPLTSAHELDEESVDRLVDHLVDGGVNGVFVLGTSGEGPWLTLGQQRRVVQQVARQLDGRVPLLAGALEASTARTIQAVEAAQDAGADAIVATVPYYFPVDDEAQTLHFRTVARAAAPLPVLLYNIPQRTHSVIDVDTVRRLLDVETIVGIKDSAGDAEAFGRILALKNERPDFVVLQGAERMVTASVAGGADGCVPGLGNLVPGLFCELVDAARRGEERQATALQERVNTLWQLHTFGFSLACLKYAAAVLGFGSGATCQHRDPLSDQAKHAIRELLDASVPAREEVA
jgi:4-hydroxy-tetrahydrodipicolinate synthase